MAEKKGSQYESLGVDAHKESVKDSFGGTIDNDHPLAFCNIVEDPLNPGYVLTQHMDGDGSKFIQRLLHYGETGDATVIRGAVDDGLGMNVGDISASGFINNFIVTDVININAANAPKDVIMKQVAIRFSELRDLYQQQGINMKFLGGETADLPDQVKSIVFDVGISSRTHETRLIAGNIQPGDVIFGMASDGKAAWEDEENSGLMSNGLTMARIKLMSEMYNKSYPHLIRSEKPFEGKYLVSDTDDRLGSLTISEAIMSPTRQWAFAIKKIIDELEQRENLHLLHGIVMNTGGGASKALNIGENICYKKRMPEPPAIFQLIQEESGELWEHMFTTFNCGVGIDIIGSPEGGILEEILNMVSEFIQIELFNLGECEASEGNKVELLTPYGEFSYQ